MYGITFFRCRYEGEVEIEEEWEIEYVLQPEFEILSTLLVAEIHEDGTRNESPGVPAAEFEEHVTAADLERLAEEIDRSFER